MNNRYVIFLLVAILVAIGIAGSMAKTVFQFPADPGRVTVTSFSVTRPALSPGESTTVRVSFSNDTRGAVTYAWKADAGTLSAADTNPVMWTAPAAEGHYRVGVEVTNAGGSRASGSAGILVSRHPSAELVVSVDPMYGTKRGETRNDRAAKEIAGSELFQGAHVP